MSEKALLIKWILKKHADVDSLGDIDVEGIKAAVLIRALDEGKCVDINELIALSREPPADERGRPKRVSVDLLATGTSASQPSSPNLPSQGVTSSSASCTSTSPRCLTHPDFLFFPPVLLRRPIQSDVRPFHSHHKQLSLLRDKMISSQSYRTRLVHLAGLESALIACNLNGRRVMEIESALDLPSAVVRGMTSMLKKGVQDRPNTETTSSLQWRVECLKWSFEHQVEAVKAFSECENSLKDWRVCCVLLIIDSLEGNFTELCSRLLTCANKPTQWEDPLQELSSAIPEGAMMSSHVALELYSGLVALFMSQDDDEPVDQEVVYDVLAPLREMWGISSYVHGVVKSTMAVELLTIEGSKDASTQNAMCRMVELFPKPEDESDKDWCLSLIASVIGRLYQMFLVPSFTSPSSSIHDIVRCCAYLGDQYLYKDLEPYLSAVLNTIGATSPFSVDDDISSVARDLVNNGVWFGVSINWKMLQSNVKKQLEQELPPPVVTRKLSALLDGSDYIPEKAELPRITLAIGILKKLPREMEKHISLLSATNSQPLRAVAAASYFRHIISLFDDEDDALNMACDETMQMLALMKGIVQRHPASSCIIDTLSLLSPRLMKSAGKRITALQESMSDFVESAIRKADWMVEEGQKLVLPEIIDCFACFNENMSTVNNFFFPNSTVFAKGIVQCASGSTQCLAEHVSRRFHMPTAAEGSLDGLMMLQCGGSLGHAVIALNSLLAIEEEYVKTISLFSESWSAVCPLIGEASLNTASQTKGTLAYLGTKKDELTRYLAAVMTFGNQAEDWKQGLYSIDMKHYKKYKHDKKYLLKNGACSHLRFSGVSIRDMLAVVDQGMNSSLPFLLQPDVRMHVVEYSLKMWCILFEWVLLGDSSTEKYGRHFHEEQTPRLLEDITYIEGFYNAGGTVCLFATT